jgi:NADPH2:quinone reductase
MQLDPELFRRLVSTYQVRKTWFQAFAGKWVNLRGYAAVTAAVGPKGVDVVYDPVGGAAFTQGLRCVAWGGQCLVIGFASGDIPKLPLNLALVKNITVHGVYWGSHAQHAPGVLAKSMRELMGLLAAGKLPVNVSHAYPLEAAHLAFKVRKHLYGQLV